MLEERGYGSDFHTYESGLGKDLEWTVLVSFDILLYESFMLIDGMK